MHVRYLKLDVGGQIKALTVNSENSERSVTELLVKLILANACCVSEYAFGADVILLTVIWPAFTAVSLICVIVSLDIIFLELCEYSKHVGFVFTSVNK